MATAVNKIVSYFAYKVSTKCRMEYDDAFQELSIAELNARGKFNINYTTKNGEWATYETYLRSVLEGFSTKLVAKNLKQASYSLDAMLGYGEEDSPSAESNQVFISYDEHRYKGVDWKVFIEQEALDNVDAYIMEMLLEGWNQADIADFLEVSQPAVRQRLNRYKETLAGSLRD